MTGNSLPPRAAAPPLASSEPQSRSLSLPVVLIHPLHVPGPRQQIYDDLDLGPPGSSLPVPNRSAGQRVPPPSGRDRNLSFSLADWGSTWCEWKPPLLPASCGFLTTFIIHFALPDTPGRGVPPNMTLGLYVVFSGPLKSQLYSPRQRVSQQDRASPVDPTGHPPAFADQDMDAGTSRGLLGSQSWPWC